jgi:hypothetical protein
MPRSSSGSVEDQPLFDEASPSGGLSNIKSLVKFGPGVIWVGKDRSEKYELVDEQNPSIPDSCALRVARSRVFVYKSKPRARLVVKYKTRSPAQVKTTYTARLANGQKLVLGSLRKRFGAQGTFKLPVALAEDAAEKVRSAKSFTAGFSIPGAPKVCARAYAKELTKKQQVPSSPSGSRPTRCWAGSSSARAEQSP